MKLNRLLLVALLGSLACVLSAGESNCGCSDCSVQCINGEFDNCLDSTHAAVCHYNRWVSVDCGSADMVCNAKSHQCEKSSSGNGGGNGGNGGNGGGGNASLDKLCSKVVSCGGDKTECQEMFQELSEMKTCQSQVNALFECATALSECDKVAMSVIGLDDSCATQLEAVEQCDEENSGGNGGGGNGGGGNGSGNASLDKLCSKVVSCGGDKAECQEMFKEMSERATCQSQVNALFECASALSECDKVAMSVIGLDDSCATQLEALDNCEGVVP